MKMKKCFITALLGLLAVPTVLFAETPAEVQAWYDAEVRKAEANLADAEALAKANPNSPSMQSGAQRMRQNHANLLMMLQREYQRRMQQAQQGNSAGGAILPPLPPVYAPEVETNTAQEEISQSSGIKGLSLDGNRDSENDDDQAMTIDAQVAELCNGIIHNYGIVLSSLRKVRDAASAQIYMNHFDRPASNLDRKLTPSQRFKKAHADIEHLTCAYSALIDLHTAAVVNKAAQPYIPQIQQLEKQILVEQKRIIAHEFYQSADCELWFRSQYKYDGPTKTNIDWIEQEKGGGSYDSLFR